MTDDYGFGALRSKVAAIRPPTDGAAAPNPAEIARIDAAADRQGFPSRQPEQLVSYTRKKREMGPSVTINTRVPARIASVFQQFCDEKRYAYWEGLEHMMREAGLLPPQDDP